MTEVTELCYCFSSKSKCFLISRLQSLSAVILEPKAGDGGGGGGGGEDNVCHCFRDFPIYLPGNYGTECQALRFSNVEF